MLFGRSSLYMTGPRTFKILKDFNLVKFNLLLSLMVQMNVVFVFGVLYRRYTLFFFLRVGFLTFFLLVNFFIILLKNTKFYRSSFYNSQIFSTDVTVCGISSSHFLISNEMSALNSLFIKNGVLLVMLCSEVLYAIILIGNSLTQLVY